MFANPNLPGDVGRLELGMFEQHFWWKSDVFVKF